VPRAALPAYNVMPCQQPLMTVLVGTGGCLMSTTTRFAESITHITLFLCHSGSRLAGSPDFHASGTSP
jgi:hypothetical protein